MAVRNPRHRALLIVGRDVVGVELDSGEPAVKDDRGVLRSILVRLGCQHSVDPLAVAPRPPRAQQEHGQALVMMAPFADLLTLVEDGPSNALARAGDGVLLDPVECIIDGRFPRAAKVHAARAVTEVVGRGAGHADAPTRVLDNAVLGKRLDEGILLFDRPAVVAVADGHGGEGD